MSAAKTSCAVSRAEFISEARVMACEVEGQPVGLAPKLFSTGSFGYQADGKVTVEIAGRRVQCQLSFLLKVIGSKDQK